MSLNSKNELVKVAKIVCRDLRKNSTNAERIFWEAVRNRKFLNKKFYRQYPIFHDITGRETFFVADFYINENKLVIELDGIIHKYRLAEDDIRTEILNSLGLRVVRFSNDEIEIDIKKVLNSLIKYLKSNQPCLSKNEE